MEKFELFMGALGNGLTVCNKAVMKDGDYEKVAHISDAGNITWYQKPSTIPGDALLRIEHQAHVMEAKFQEWFSAKSEIQQYAYLLDRAPSLTLLETFEMKDASITEKLEKLKKTVFPML